MKLNPNSPFLAWMWLQTPRSSFTQPGLTHMAFLNFRALLPTQGAARATATVPGAGLQGPQGDSHQACSQVSHQDRVPPVLCPALFLAGPRLMKQ